MWETFRLKSQRVGGGGLQEFSTFGPNSTYLYLNGEFWVWELDNATNFDTVIIRRQIFFAQVGHPKRSSSSFHLPPNICQDVR